jgi:mannose-6-phosphate isomerase-like protein (cupin superfamily)
MEEVFYFLAGAGLMQVGAERAPVQAGDRVIVPPHAAHYLRNTGAAPMRFVTFGVQVAAPAGQ